MKRSLQDLSLTTPIIPNLYVFQRIKLNSTINYVMNIELRIASIVFLNTKIMCNLRFKTYYYNLCTGFKVLD